MNAEGKLIEVMHGVNLDMLGQRDPEIYGTLTLPQLQEEISRFAAEFDLEIGFFQSNHEGEFVERLHQLRDSADAIVLNPGAWTHYSWAIRDALEIASLPACEVHLSNIKSREPWRSTSVIEDLCLESFVGHGPGGYKMAFERLSDELGRGS